MGLEEELGKTTVTNARNHEAWFNDAESAAHR